MKYYIYINQPYFLEGKSYITKLCSKIHQNKLSIPIDDLTIIPLLRKVVELQIAVMIYSNPTTVGGFYYCSPTKVSHIIKKRF